MFVGLSPRSRTKLMRPAMGWYRLVWRTLLRGMAKFSTCCLEMLRYRILANDTN